MSGYSSRYASVLPVHAVSDVRYVGRCRLSDKDVRGDWRRFRHSGPRRVLPGYGQEN